MAAFELFRLLLYQTIVVGAILYCIIKRVFYVPYEEASRPQRRKFVFTSKQPKSKKSKTPRPTPAPRSTPVSKSPQSSSRSTSCDSSSSSDTVVDTPYRTQPRASVRRVVPQAPPPTSLERFETDLNRAAAQNPFLSAALSRLTTCMQTTLRIRPGTARTAILLHILHRLHFTIAPNRPLPLRDDQPNRHLSARELACVFLNTNAPIIWPSERFAAPHLLDRSLQYPRDTTVPSERHAEWFALMAKPPKKGSAADLAMSKLGRAVTGFVELVYELPWERVAVANYAPTALLLDFVSIREGGFVVGPEGVPEHVEGILRATPDLVVTEEM